MSRSDRIQKRRLEELEEEFEQLLTLCLQRCAKGRYGLFGQNEHLYAEAPYLAWPEAIRTHQLAEEIQALRHVFGDSNPLCEEFLQLRRRSLLRESNMPGEPKLAAYLLKKIEAENRQNA